MSPSVVWPQARATDRYPNTFVSWSATSWRLRKEHMNSAPDFAEAEALANVADMPSTVSATVASAAVPEPVAPAGLTQTVSAVATTNFHQNIVVAQRRTGPGFLTRAVWYLFVGWWLTGLAIGFAWLCALSVVLLPVAYLIVGKLPMLLTLRPRSLETDVALDADGTLRITTGGALQLPFWQRALWFLFVGWWACALAMAVAYLASLTVVLLPIGLMIFNRVPAVMTLQRN
jgi:uncharacterized membrane protein YccF (DUF307 family)